MENLKLVREVSVRCQRRPRAKFNRISVPSILLTGKWLENAGFMVEDKVEVEVHHNKLVIRPVIRIPANEEQLNKYLKFFKDGPDPSCVDRGYSMGISTC